MIPRYETPEMAALWSEASHFQVWTEVELAACEAWESLGQVPQGTAGTVARALEGVDWSAFARRVREIEQTTRHDVIAYLSALEEVAGEPSRHIHFGMTSSDVVDTANAVLLVRAGEVVLRRLERFRDALWEKALVHQATPTLGRTHGQAAEVTSFGLKLAGFVAEAQRGVERLHAALREVAHGKLSGAVGNYGNIDPKIEAFVMKRLGLRVETVSTQIVPRDRHAMFYSTLAVIAGLVERFAVEVRHLMRTEVSEAFEPFGKGQRGSSAMPHKKNPILTENVTGLARLVRSYTSAAYENMALWHERDISHSSAERVMAPDATTALDFALRRLTGVVEGLVVDEARMNAHIESTGGLVFSESVLLALVETGVLRQRAYGWVQTAAMQARDTEVTFFDALLAQPDVASRLDEGTLTRCFDVQHHLRHVEAVFARVGHTLTGAGASWREA